MNILYNFILIIASVSLCMILFHFYYFYENYEYIIKFNESYSKLEYTSSANFNYTDITVLDPNDTIFDSTNKIRCNEYGGYYYPLSRQGFLSGKSTEITKKFTHYKDCILYAFSVDIPILYNPCVMPSSRDCMLLNTLLK